MPLALPKNYTYAVPEEMEDKVQPGSRVAVQFGKTRKYAAVVKKLSETPPDAYSPKPLLSVLDEEPVVHPSQLRFWEWLAGYYMCSEGEVLNAVLPSHLKISSETVLLFNEAYGTNFESLNDAEFLVAEALSLRKELTVDEVQQILDKVNVYPVIKKLIEDRICLVYEELKESYRPKQENFVSLNPEYGGDEKLSALFDELKAAPKQLELLLAFIHLSRTEGEVKQKDLLQKSGATPAHLKALSGKNILLVERRAADRIPASGTTAPPLEFELNEEQAACLDSIRLQFTEKQVVLLHGVTSSGKTMVYIRLIAEYLQSGRQVLYLLPEIALTAQIIRRLQKHFGDQIAVYHSRFSSNERMEIWNRIRSGDTRLVIGARSALMLPFKSLGLIILDEEHDSSFKQQEPAPRYHARDAAVYYAGILQARVLMGSATPSVESYFNACRGKYGLARLTHRYGGVKMPVIEIVDAKLDAFQKKSVEHFTSVLKAEMDHSLAAGKQVILFQNRRGYAPFLACTVCGWIPKCQNCDVSLTWHKFQDKLHCHYCGQKYPYVHTCPACGSNKLVARSFGTEKIEDDLRKVFPKANVARLDYDAVRTKEGHNKLISLFEQRRIDILVGTQMVVKGLDFENVNLVGILNADSLLNYPDFRVNERAFQLMEQVSGRSGRKDVQGKVIIQAGNLKHPVLEYVVRHDYQSMYEAETDQRERFGYPPFSRLIKITLKHKKQPVVTQAADQLAVLLRPFLENYLVGPAAPLVGRIRNYYLMELLVKLPRDARKIAEIKRFLREQFNRLQENKSFRPVIIVPDVDCI